MKSRKAFNPLWLFTVVCISVAPVLAQSDYYDKYTDDEILTRGPVHEAFAEPIVFDPEPGPLAPTAPPEPVDEIPPDERIEGGDVIWIPGYWAWDDEDNQFLWVSGLWRDAPPGHEWVAGYWTRAPQGYQWVSGYWADSDETQMRYLPEPPEWVNAAPPAAPSPDRVWVPGCWLWQQNGYGWRPGYWTMARPDWVWVPAHYNWTPRGYVFVDGYWDHTVEHCGLLFAPVRFEKRIYTKQRIRYSPRTVVDIRVFTDHLFMRPKHNHYYFGDYYDQRYTNAGYRPWFSVQSSRRVYDPIYVQRRWEHRNDHDWDAKLRRDFNNRRDHQEFRPAHNLAEQKRRRGAGGPNNHNNNHKEGGITGLVKTLAQVVQRKQSPLKFQRVDDSERRRIAQRRDELQDIRKHRQEQESRKDNKPDNRYSTRTKPSSVTRYKAPTATITKPKTTIAIDRKPPPKPQLPKVDTKIEPKRRNLNIIKKPADRPQDKKSTDNDTKKPDNKKDDKKNHRD